MNNEQATSVITKAHSLSQEVTSFFCAAVGRSINSNEEFSLLVEWHDAIKAALAAARRVRSAVDVADLTSMFDECCMWLDHWHTEVA